VFYTFVGSVMIRDTGLMDEQTLRVNYVHKYVLSSAGLHVLMLGAPCTLC
jgi:hypothetical protein